jgi:hypothetical protein
MPTDLTKIVSQWDTGTGDMGSLTFGRTIGGTVDDNHNARFGMKNMRYILIAIRGHFSLGTSAVADFVINIDSGLGEAHDAALDTFKNAGTGSSGSDIHFRVCESDLMHWVFDGRREDTIVCTWTNPNTIRWGLEVFFAPILEDTIPTVRPQL